MKCKVISTSLSEAWEDFCSSANYRRVRKKKEM
jgi:hypothetical protein